MSKKYVIRSFVFGYNDENFYVCGWHVGEIFDDREKAEASYRQLQINYLRDLNLCEHQYIFDGDAKYLDKVDQYLKEKGGSSMLNGSNYVEFGHNPHWELDDDVLFEFGEFAKMHAYKLIEFDDEPKFYALYDPRENDYARFFDECFEGPIYGSSLDEANELLAEQVDDYGDDWQAGGALDALSDNPAMLRSLIDSSKGVRYDESKSRLYLKRPRAEDVIALNALLKQPIYEIRELDASEIRALENEMMEGCY